MKLIKSLCYPCTHYKTLNLAPTATPEQIKASYYRLAKQKHPDVNYNDRQSFQKVKQAYDTLADPIRREQYDHSINPPKQERIYYPEDEEEHNRNPFDMITFIYTSTVLYVMYKILERLTPLSIHQIKRQSIFNTGKETPDVSPSKYERRKQQYANEVKQKQVRAKIIQVKVGNGAKQTTKARERKKNCLLAISGVTKEKSKQDSKEKDRQFIE